MKLVWVTDIHLNFIEKSDREIFYQSIVETQADSVLITGDIAEAPSLVFLLTEMANYIQKDIYFVLGNHDYYHGDVKNVREAMEQLTKTHTHLFWMPAISFKLLSNDMAMVGADGWADGRYGDYVNTRVVLNDSRLIGDLFNAKIFGKFPLLNAMQKLSDNDTALLLLDIEKVLKTHPKTIIVLTHVPPFRETCMHEGKVSDDDWLPFFGAKSMGEMLMKVAAENPPVKFVVYCGHTHSEAVYQCLPNLIVRAGKAEYLKPEIVDVLRI